MNERAKYFKTLGTKKYERFPLSGKFFKLFSIFYYLNGFVKMTLIIIIES
jgi:hypothetical protein